MQTEYDMQVVDEQGMPEPVRMPTAKVMKKTLDEMIQVDLHQAKARAAIQGLVNGNKPYSDQKLKDEGQAFRENWNDRQAESAIDTRCGADFNLLFDVGQVISVFFTPGLFPDPRIEQEYANRIARAYSHVFTRESQIIEATQRAIRDRIELGVGFLLFPDPLDWRPKAIRRGRCFFNETASANCEDIELFFALDAMTIAELYEILDDPKASEKAGWNLTQLKKELVDYFYRGSQRRTFQNNYALMFEDLQQRIRTNDPGYYSKQYASFPIVHGFVQERTGKVSQYVISYGASKQEEYLFESFEAHPDMASVVVPVPYDYGDGTLASVKGMGHRIFAIATASLRTLMHTFDVAKMSSSLIVQNSTGGDNLALSMHRFGPVTLIDRNLTPIQTSFTPKLDVPFALRELLQRIMNNNNGVLRTQQEDTLKRESVKTAEEIRTQRGREVEMENDRVFLTYLRWDALHQQVFKRLCAARSRSGAAPEKARKSAELFLQICEVFGVPKEFLEKYQKHITVRSTRSIGAGSTGAKQDSLMAAKNVTSSSMSEAGRRQLDRELVGVFLGNENVDRFIPLADDSQVPSNETSIAQLETNQMEMGEQVLVGVDQIHAQHMAVHLATMVGYAQQLQSDPMNVDIERAAQLFQLGLPHVMRHLEILASDPMREAQAAEYKQTIDQLIPVAQQLMQAFEEIQKAKQEEIQRLREENMRLQQEFSKENLAHQREMAKIQLQAEAEQQKTANLNANRDAKTQTQLQIAVEKMGQKLAMDQMRFQQEMAEKQTKMQQEIQATETKIQIMLQEAQAKMMKGVGGAGN